MENTFKVAVIEPVGGHGGMDYYDFGLCQGLANAGVDVLLFTCDETDEPLGQHGFLIRRVYKNIFGQDPPWVRGLRYLKGSFSALFQCLIQRRIIVHFHLFGVGPLEFMNVLMAKLIGRKVVVTAHDVESFVPELEAKFLLKYLYRMADAVIVHNCASKNEIINTIGISEDLLSVILQGNFLYRQLHLPNQNEARKALKLPKQGKIVLFFGQIKEVKGLDILLKAMPSLINIYPDVCLLIAGRPWKTDFSIYQNIIDKLNIGNNIVSHIRFIPDEEVLNYFTVCDIVVLPYRRIYQSAVVLMAMSYGKVVLASDLPSMTEMIFHGENGFLFKQGNEDSLSYELSQALAESVSLPQIGNNAREYVRKNNDWDVIGQKTCGVYQGLSS